MSSSTRRRWRSASSRDRGPIQARSTSAGPLTEISELIHRRELSPLELAEATRRIERLNPLLNCYLASPAGGGESARPSSRRCSPRRLPGPTARCPVSLKDNIATVDLPTTAGSAVLARRRPAQPAAVVQRLVVGAVVIGKCHLFELAYRAAHPGTARRTTRGVTATCGGSSSARPPHSPPVSAMDRSEPILEARSHPRVLLRRRRVQPTYGR